MHLHLDHLHLLTQEPRFAEAFVEALHRHMLEACTRCRVEWEAISSARPEEPVDAPPPVAARPRPQRLPTDEHLFSLEHLNQRKKHLAMRREMRRRESKDLKKLLDQAPGERAAMIERSRTRYQSRMLAELLLEACREHVHADPAAAREVASLVPQVVERIPGKCEAWRFDLVSLAEAHQANTHRVGGDLGEADQAFARLQDRLTETPLGSPRHRAELLCLEATLRIEQGDLAEADQLLEEALALQIQANDRRGRASTLLLVAESRRRGGEPQIADRLLKEAEDLLDDGWECYRYL